MRPTKSDKLIKIANKLDDCRRTVLGVRNGYGFTESTYKKLQKIDKSLLKMADDIEKESSRY